MQFKLISLLSGKKTYLVGLCMIILGYYNNDERMIMEGIGFITMRQAISKMQ